MRDATYNDDDLRWIAGALDSAGDLAEDMQALLDRQPVARQLLAITLVVSAFCANHPKLIPMLNTLVDAYRIMSSVELETEGNA